METAGLVTVTLSPIPDLTAAVSVPRIAAIGYPLGRPLGQPGDVQGQAAVLRAALRVVETAENPGTVVSLPFEWPEPSSSVHSSPADPPPIAKLLKRKPWLLPRLIDRE